MRELIQQHHFEFFVTADKNLPFQQNLDKLEFKIILLDTPTLLWQHQVQFVPKIREVIGSELLHSTKIVHISIEGFAEGRKKQQLRPAFTPEQVLFL